MGLPRDRTTFSRRSCCSCRAAPSPPIDTIGSLGAPAGGENSYAGGRGAEKSPRRTGKGYVGPTYVWESYVGPMGPAVDGCPMQLKVGP
jgi:hypothetical protein